MARWDDIRRAILARDQDGTERIWLELLEAGTLDVPRFLDAAKLLSRQQGGKRQAGALLWLLVEGLEKGERPRDILGVLRVVGEMNPDDATVRERAIAAANAGWADREDLEVLIDRSEVKAGPTDKLPDAIHALERSLQIEHDAYVFHRSGWGVGKVVEYDANRGVCTIDFRTRPGHEMKLDAAARILERLEEGDIRVRAMVDQRGLRKYAKEEPLEVLRQVVGWYGNSVALGNVKEALVPDAVATSTWAAWWKSARKSALLDPRFEVSGTGRNARIDVHEIEQADFRTQVEKALRRADKILDRQKTIKELAKSVVGDDEAVAVLEEVTDREAGRYKSDPAVQLGWQLVIAEIKGEDPEGRVADMLAVANDPLDIVSSISDDKIRRSGAKAFLKARPDNLSELAEKAIEGDDPILAEEAAAFSRSASNDEVLGRLVQAADNKPAMRPNLYGWYLKEWRKGRFPENEHEIGSLVRRVLKVIDAVEYRQRRKGSAKDKKAVTVLGDLLADKKGAMVREACEVVTTDQARRLLARIGEIRGLRNVVVGRLQDIILHAHPEAGRREKHDDAVDEAVVTEIYMTGAGIARLRKEVEHIENIEMPANREEIARAREFGDLKENAEYHAAREKQGLLTAKVANIKADLQRAVEITSAIVSAGSVSVGTRVRLRDGGGAVHTYTLFGPPDTDVERGIINYMAPLGQALMGRTKGDQVRLDIDGEVRELEVLEIETAV